jgi:glycosyltransferase involved in cell wall biosynthesis
MTKISAILIVKNEEDNIIRCLDSICWVDQVVVVDTGSSDRTRELAEKAGADVFDLEWMGFGASKAFALSKATGDWVLSIDADEVIIEPLAKEIKNAVEMDFDGFRLPRLTNFLGRWIRHSGWYPDYNLRLFRRSCGKFTDSLVHEEIIVKGKTSRLKNHLLHYSYPKISTYFEKFRSYTDLAAKDWHNHGRKYSLGAAVLKPVIAFYRHYIFRAGFLDGFEGFLIAVSSAFGVLIKYVKLRELERSEKSD